MYYTMMLHELTRSSGRKDKPFRLGRGNSARKGNYSGRGLGGQKSRAGWWVPNWFEWWQTPLHMRLPKLRWFKRYFKLLKNITPISLATIEADDRIKNGSTVDMKVLKECRYVSKETSLVKILGKDTMKKKLTFSGIHAFSAWARAVIEKAWGSIE